MPDWRSIYADKLTSAGNALGKLQSRERVFIHMAAGAPRTLIEALCLRLPELRGVEILHCINLGDAPYAQPEFEPHCRHNALFVAANTRAAVQAGRADYTPIFLHEVERLFTHGILPIDVALIQVSPPDSSGHMSLGPAVDISFTAARMARHAIAQVNPRVPRTHGESFVTARDVDAIVESERPLPEYLQGEITEVHHAIARQPGADYANPR